MFHSVGGYPGIWGPRSTLGRISPGSSYMYNELNVVLVVVIISVSLKEGNRHIKQCGVSGNVCLIVLLVDRDKIAFPQFSMHRTVHQRRCETPNDQPGTTGSEESLGRTFHCNGSGRPRLVTLSYGEMCWGRKRSKACQAA